MTELQKRLKRWWWPPLVILGGLLGKSWLVGNWLSGVARSEAADVAGIPVARVEADGLNMHLTGFTSEAEMEAAVAAVEALDSSWEVTGEMADDASPASDTGDELDELAQTTSAPPTVPSTTATSSAPATSTTTTTTTTTSTTTSTTSTTTSDLAAGPEVEADSGAEPGDEPAAGPETGDEPVADRPLAGLLELDPIEFGYLSWFVPSNSLPVLDQAAAVINSNPEAGPIRVIGYTDSDGVADKNVELSLLRAQIVVDYLITSGGVDPSRLEAVGRGEDGLKVEPELTARDKQRNRRIEWELPG